MSAISLVGVVWWAVHQDAPRFPTSPGSLALIFGSVGVYFVATVLRGWRWHLILGRAGVVHEAIDAYALTAVGYMGNTVLPARGGEFLRMMLMSSRSSAGHRHVLGSILTERLVDAFTLVVLFALMTWTRVSGAPVGQAPAALAAIATALAAAGLVFYLRVRRRGRLERFAARVRPFVGPTRPLLGRFGVGVAAVTAIVWTLEGVIAYAVGRSLGISLGLFDAAFLIVLASFFALIPAAPGYIGTFEAAIIFGLAALDVEGSVALSFALLVRFVLFVPVTVAGLSFLLVRYGGFGRAEIRRGNAGSRERPREISPSSSGRIDMREIAN